MDSFPRLIPHLGEDCLLGQTYLIQQKAELPTCRCLTLALIMVKFLKKNFVNEAELRILHELLSSNKRYVCGTPYL